MLSASSLRSFFTNSSLLVGIAATALAQSAPPPDLLSVPLADFMRRDGKGDVIDLRQLDSRPIAVKQVRPIYPINLRVANLTGEVLVGFIVDTSGGVQDVHVVRSNNPGFERAAINAVQQWRFNPGKKAGAPVNTRMQVPVVFSIKEDGVDVGRSLWTITPPKEWGDTATHLRWDVAPSPKYTAFAVYPFELYTAGTKAKFRLTYLVGPEGKVMQCKADGAPAPEFAHAAAAMMDQWQFTPAKMAGEPRFAILTMDVDFSRAPTTHAPLTDSAHAILKELRKPSPAIATLAELDGMPRAISRRSPVYPTALLSEAPEGEAVIEFFIDQKGDAQLPRIVSHSRPEFGYAAAQAVAAWRFEAPLKSGKPRITRAVVPFKFAAPKLKSPATPSAAAGE